MILEFPREMGVEYIEPVAVSAEAGPERITPIIFKGRFGIHPIDFIVVRRQLAQDHQTGMRALG